MNNAAIANIANINFKLNHSIPTQFILTTVSISNKIFQLNFYRTLSNSQCYVKSTIILYTHEPLSSPLQIVLEEEVVSCADSMSPPHRYSLVDELDVNFLELADSFPLYKLLAWSN